MGHERAHAEFGGQSEGLLIVGFGRHDIEGIGVGIDGAKLVQLPGQVECLVGTLPGLLAAPRQTPDLAEPCDPGGKTLQRARAETFVDRLLQQRAPLREAPLERIGITQARCDHSQPVPVAGGTTEGQALLQHPDGVLQVPLGEVQVAEAAMGNDRCLPSAFRASRARDPIRTSVPDVPDSLSVASTLRRSNSAARPKSPMAKYVCPRK